MVKEDPIFEYMKKMKNITEFLARGNEIVTQDKKIINFDRQMITEEGCISIEEAELFDTLECKYYNELGSIHRMSELITKNTTYEELEAAILPYISQPFDSKKIDETHYEEYKMLKNRMKELLNKIVIQIYMGLRAKPTSIEIALVEALDEESRRKKQTSEEAQIGEDDQEAEFDEYIEDLEESIPQEEPKQEEYLIYGIGQGKFYLMQNDEVLVENVDLNLAMEIVTGYLYREEKERLTEGLLTGKFQKMDIEYDGIHIYIDKDAEQR